MIANKTTLIFRILQGGILVFAILNVFKHVLEKSEGLFLFQKMCSKYSQIVSFVVKLRCNQKARFNNRINFRPLWAKVRIIRTHHKNGIATYIQSPESLLYY